MGHPGKACVGAGQAFNRTLTPAVLASSRPHRMNTNLKEVLTRCYQLNATGKFYCLVDFWLKSHQRFVVFSFSGTWGLKAKYNTQCNLKH